MILVIGDIIVDEFLWGDAHRISPEAPVPVVNISESDRRLGGSANVIRNLHALDEPCAMFGVVGDDEAGRWVGQRLEALGVEHQGVLIKSNGRPTAVKTRIIARHQQMLRFDREWASPLTATCQQQMLSLLADHIPQAGMVILSDYAKGVLTPETITAILQLADKHGCRVGIDPKPEHTAAYQGATFITPNLQEAAAMSGLPAINTDEHVAMIAESLHRQLSLTWVLLTRSECGMTLFDGQQCHHIPTEARDVFDVTGAGDTVIASFATALLRGEAPLQAAITANKAAGIVVGKVGTATASWQEIHDNSAL